MAISDQKQPKSNAVFQLKGSLVTLTALHLLKPDLVALSEQLSALIKQTPKFFQHMPVILDLHKLAETASYLDFNELLSCLRTLGLIPIGIRGGNPQQQQGAIQAGLAILPNTKSEPIDLPTQQPSAAPSSATPVSTSSKVITQPVRSGQQIYARNTDLIVLAPVSPGAELIADGHIHIYGSLRGRALAGVSGNQEARIFCQSLEAELVSIAGHYWVSEDLQKSPKKQSVNIFLNNDRLQIATF